MNILQITNMNYTTPFKLYLVTIRFRGTTEACIRPFSTNTVSVELPTENVLVSNVRSYESFRRDEGDYFTTFLADVAIFEITLGDAMRRIIDCPCVDLTGLGGIAQFNGGSIEIISIDEGITATH